MRKYNELLHDKGTESDVANLSSEIYQFKVVFFPPSKTNIIEQIEIILCNLQNF